MTMKHKIHLLAAIVAVMTAAGIASAQTADTDSLKGKPAPDFALKTAAGPSVKLSGLRGKVVVLDFWATWCPPCRKSLPHLQKLSADAAREGKGLAVLGVNEQETADRINDFMKQNQYTFVVPMDSDGAVSNDYLVQGIPTTVIVGRNGVIRDVFIGIGDGREEAIDAAVDKALAAK
jgi:thiol-disulfide isomerase/thioredoxin